jgi:hypothetical protein
MNLLFPYLYSNPLENTFYILIELPQFNTIFSRILAYSQDFITLDIDLTKNEMSSDYYG